MARIQRKRQLRKVAKRAKVRIISTRRKRA
jgi:hypothetical protein